jgi:hypothetical protein
MKDNLSIAEKMCCDNTGSHLDEPTSKVLLTFAMDFWSLSASLASLASRFCATGKIHKLSFPRRHRVERIKGRKHAKHASMYN